MSARPSADAATWRELLAPAHAAAVTVLAVGVLVGAVNIYLAASLLPTAVADIGGAEYYAWNMTGYLVAMVVATMLVSRALVRFGTVGAYLLGFTAFLAGSLACALSPVMPVLLAGRCVQGLGAGLLSGLGFAVVRSALPPRMWTRGSALMSAMYGVGNFAGPAIGGLCAQFGSWRMAFVLMAAVAGVCCLLVPRVLPRGERGGAREPVPAVSLLLATAATAAVGAAGVLSAAAATAAAIGAALLLAGFVAHERRSAHRVFPAAAYRPGSPLAWVYLTLALLAFGVAVESFVPLFGQRLGGLPPAAAGFVGAAVSLGWSATQVVSSSASADRTVRALRVLGPLLLACGLLALCLLMREGAPSWQVLAWVPVLLAAGAGIGAAYPHLCAAVMAGTPDPDEGRRAAAAIAAVTSLSIAFGTAVAGVLVRLGGPSAAGSARAVLLGLALVCAAGTLTALAADRRARRGPPSGR